MIEMANFIYSVSYKRDLIFYVHDLLTQRGNIYSIMMLKAHEKDLMRTLLFTDNFDLSFCAKRIDIN